jgi:hypothetical protein
MKTPTAFLVQQLAQRVKVCNYIRVSPYRMVESMQGVLSDAVRDNATL